MFRFFGSSSANDPINDTTKEEASYNFDVVASTQYDIQIQHASTPQRGSMMGHKYTHYNHKSSHDSLERDYFANDPIYLNNIFRRRFRTSRVLFMCIHNVVVNCDEYFVQRRNAVGKEGLSSLQKITAALHMLAYGVTGDLFDEYIRIDESTSNEAMKQFVSRNHCSFRRAVLVEANCK